MANRKIAGELNVLLKNSGGTKGIRTHGAYRKNRESVELGDNANKVECDSKSHDESKRKEDDLEGKSSQECSGENSEADSKAKQTVSDGSVNSSKADVESGDCAVDKDRNVKEKRVSGEEKTADPDSEDRSRKLETVSNNKNENSVGKPCAVKGGVVEKETGAQSKQLKTGKDVNSGSSAGANKTKFRTRPVIGSELLLKKNSTPGSSQDQDKSSTVTQESERRSFHERYTRREISDYNSNKVKEAESSDVNSNVKKVPKIGRMGFSLDLNKELNAKFAAARLQMTGSCKKQVPITTTPTEGKKQPPVPLRRPRKPEGKTSFEVKRERSKRGLLVDPDEQKEENNEESSKYVDLDTGHIYEDIDLYQEPKKCETCSKETTDKDEQVKEDEGKKDGKKKKKSKLKMLCMCRQTSSDLPSASLSEKSDSKICLLAGENKARFTAENEKKEKSEGGYERLQRQKPSFRGGYEALRNSSPEEEESKLPPEGAKAAGAVVKKREFKNESTKSESVVSNVSTSEHFEKYISKGSSYDSKSESDGSKKSLSKIVRFEEKTENIVEESSEEHHSGGNFEHKLGLDTKRKEVLYAKVMKTSHKSEHSESVVEAGGFSRSSWLQRFGAVPVLPFEGRLPILGKVFHKIAAS